MFNLVGLAKIIGTRCKKLKGVDDFTTPFWQDGRAVFKIIGIDGQIILVTLAVYKAPLK